MGFVAMPRSGDVVYMAPERRMCGISRLVTQATFATRAARWIESCLAAGEEDPLGAKMMIFVLPRDIGSDVVGV